MTSMRVDYIGLVEHIRQRRIFSAPYPHFFGEDPREQLIFHHPLFQMQNMRGMEVATRVGVAIFEMDVCEPLSEQVEDLEYHIHYYPDRGTLPDESIFIEDLFPFYFLSLSRPHAYIHALIAETGEYRKIQDPFASVEEAEEWMYELASMENKIRS